MPDSRPSRSTRPQVRERARGVCEYCRIPDSFAPDSFEVEHIIPLGKGGASSLDNLAWSCGGCNGFKGRSTHSLDLLGGQVAPLFNPRRGAWKDHFAWVGDDALFVEGLTATGRASVSRMKMNRPGLRNLRRLLRSVNKHPPAHGA